MCNVKIKGDYPTFIPRLLLLGEKLVKKANCEIVWTNWFINDRIKTAVLDPEITTLKKLFMDVTVAMNLDQHQLPENCLRREQKVQTISSDRS